MNIKNIIFLLFLLQLFSIYTKGKSKIIYLFSIKEEINAPVWHRTKKAIKEAENKKADIIFIDMNSYGGMVIYADSIRTAILESKIPVYVFINNNAASAAALISIACNKIFMRPGSSIGAATVVDQEGNPLPDKYQSYMRAIMRTTASVRNRNPKIAEAMVDKDIEIDTIAPKGKVLSFTAEEAKKYKYCDAIVDNIYQALEKEGIRNYVIIKQHLTFIDKIIEFLLNPIVTSLLIMLMIGGIYFELQSPGVGFPLIISICSALLYFAPLYLEGLAENWEIILFFIGIILLLLEIFIIPGFGIAGISGIILITGGLILSLIGNIGFNFSIVPVEKFIRAFTIVFSSFFLSIVFSIFFANHFIKSKLFSKLLLNYEEKKESGYKAFDIDEKLIGKTGISITDHKPSGKIEINNKYYDSQSATGYIPKNTKVRILKIQSGRLIVVAEKN